MPKILQDVVKALEQEPVPEDFHTERAKKDLLRMLTILIGEFLIGGENFDTVLIGELRPILSTASPDPCDRQRVTCEPILPYLTRQLEIGQSARFDP